MRIKEHFISNKEYIRKGFYLFFINLAIVCGLLLIASRLNFLHIDIIVNELWLFVIIISSIVISILLRYNMNNKRESEFINTIFEISPYFFLSLLVVIALNQFLKLDFLTSRNFYLVVLAIAFGVLTFYKNRDRVEKELEDEKIKEENAEKRRYEEFATKYPKLKKFDFSYGVSRSWGDGRYLVWMFRVLLSPFVFLARLPYSLVRWMYGEGWWYSISFFFITICSVIFYIMQWRFINSFWMDEWISVETAKVFLGSSFPYLPSGNPISNSYLYFYSLSRFILFFDGWLHAGRFLNILLFLVTMPIIYTYSKIIFNKKVSLLSVLLLDFSLFVIIMVNEVRGYFFSLFLISLITLLIVGLFFTNPKHKIFMLISIFVLFVIALENHLTNSLYAAILILLYTFIVFYSKKYAHFKYVITLLIISPIIVILSYRSNIFEAFSFFFDKLIGQNTPTWVVNPADLSFPVRYLLDSINLNSFNYILLFIFLFSIIMTNKKSGRYIMAVTCLTFVILYLIPVSLNRIPDSQRYFFIILPVWSLFLSYCFFTCYYSLKSKKLRILYLTLVIFVILTIGYQNISNVPWSKTIEFEKSANIINNLSDNQTIILTNYVGAPISYYGVNLTAIFFEKQDYVFLENTLSYNKTNFLGLKYLAPPGTHFLLATPYFTRDEFEELILSNQSVVIFIRPWPVDISSETYDLIEKNSFSRENSSEPLVIYYRGFNNSSRSS
jgi:hypothetical protein